MPHICFYFNFLRQHELALNYINDEVASFFQVFHEFRVEHAGNGGGGKFGCWEGGKILNFQVYLQDSILFVQTRCKYVFGLF